VVSEFRGERQRFTDQTREALAQRVIEALDIIGFPGMLRHSLVPLRRHHTSIGVILIRVERGLLTVHHQDLRLQLWGTLTTAIPDVNGDDLAGPGINGDPDPRLVRLLSDNAPHLIRFGFQLPNDDIY